jgi:cellulose biosynthesis protein BcsQ
MLIVTCTNRKGGVLKTTLVFMMAVFFGVVKGKKVLVVDGDPSANASKSFSARIRDEADDTRILPSLSSFLESDVDIVSSDHAISLMPGDIRLTQLEHIDSVNVIEALGELRSLSQFDLILIDTAPTATNFVVAAKAISDFLVIPHSFTDFSQGGIEEVTSQLNTLRKKKISRAELLAIVPTLIDGGDEDQCKEVISALKGELAGYISPPINNRRAGRQAMASALAPWEFKTQSQIIKETLAAMAFINKRLYPITKEL